MKSSQIVVFGSVNIDLTVTVSHLPQSGETLKGNNFTISVGGKGANQAIALSRLGTPTAFIGRVGKDNWGDRILEELHQQGVNIDKFSQDVQHPTGTAMITVEEETGENQIIIISGANGVVGTKELLDLTNLLPHCRYLLLQLEIPLPVVLEAITLAKKHHVPVILDPAPAHTLPHDIYQDISIITPNAIEASQLVGFEVQTQAQVEKAGQWFLDKGVQTVIITMGADGVYCASHHEQFWLSTPPVTVVDTVGAGDAFNGGLATALVNNYSLEEAVTWGLINGSLSVTRKGEFPTLSEFQQWLKDNLNHQ
ncbi:ribokinase [Cyanobacterium stanieri PCC 7202]|uniref:Ribokinase n=1 Tax=Cyanobacterium stanieri (strain ATCC 29140 / PCC 7202) TaxID=292563 RepID=K9YGV2_CYASC|nr:ribokinase [Cyanobacterium stanieri PCC 7202]